jgi:hypothetical protein
MARLAACAHARAAAQPAALPAPDRRRAGRRTCWCATSPWWRSSSRTTTTRCAAGLRGRAGRRRARPGPGAPPAPARCPRRPACLPSPACSGCAARPADSPPPPPARPRAVLLQVQPAAQVGELRHAAAVAQGARPAPRPRPPRAAPRPPPPPARCSRAQPAARRPAHHISPAHPHLTPPAAAGGDPAAEAQRQGDGALRGGREQPHAHDEPAQGRLAQHTVRGVPRLQGRCGLPPAACPRQLCCGAGQLA